MKRKIPLNKAILKVKKHTRNVRLFVAHKHLKTRTVKFGSSSLANPIESLLRNMWNHVQKYLNQLLKWFRIKIYWPLYRRYGFWRLSSVSILLGIVLIVGIATTIHNVLLTNSYKLSPSILGIVGPADKQLLKGFKYDSKNQTYYLNKSSIGKILPPPQDVSTQGQLHAQNPYSLALPKDAHKGLAYYDNTSGLSFTLAPDFNTNPGKVVDNHLVYSTNINGAKDVYTVKANGLQENIAFNKAPSNTISLAYTIKLPNDLQARLSSQGYIGIYSADPALFGNISYGSASDRQKVAEARLKSPKTYLVFAIPPPQVEDSNGVVSNSKTKTIYKLRGNILTIVASGLGNIKGPIAIDPSVIVVNTGSLGDTNNEGDTFNLVFTGMADASLTGADITTAWTDDNENTGSYFNNARTNFASVAYNGYLYVIGGSTQTNTVVYPYSSSTTYPVSVFLPANSGVTKIQVELWGGGGGAGGSSGNNSGYGGGGGAYQTETYSGLSGSLAYSYTVGSGATGNGATMPLGVQGASSTFKLGSYTTVTAQAGGTGPHNSLGGVATGTASTNSTCPLAANTLYGNSGGNGEAYSTGSTEGAGGAAGSAGGVGGSGSLASPNDAGGAIVASTCGSGYAGTGANGANYSCTPTPSCESAPVNAKNGNTYGGGGGAGFNKNTAGGNGANGLVVVTYTYSTPVANADIQYTNLSGGTLSTPLCTDGSLSSNSPISTTGPWCTSTTAVLTSAREGLSAVAYNHTLYVLGGVAASSGTGCMTSTSTGSYCNDVQTIQINNTNGSLGSDTETSYNFNNARAFFGAAVYNDYLYIVGGYNGTSDYNDVQYAQLTANGGLSAPTCSGGSLNGDVWCTDPNTITTARQGLSAVAYNGYLYIIGGIAASTSSSCPSSGGYYCNDVQYTSLNSSSGAPSAPSCLVGTISGAWCSSPATLINPRAYFGASVYDGYIYISGGAGASGQLSDTAYININSDGSIGGSWQDTTSAIPTAMGRIGDSMVAYSGYLFVYGGCSTSATLNEGGTACLTTFSSGNVASTLNDIEIASITSPGIISGWSTDTTASLPSAAYHDQAIAYNGFMYLFPENGTETVYYTKISSTGALTAPSSCSGTFTSAGDNWCEDTSSLPSNISGESVELNNGYIYVIGSNVFYTEISSSTSGGLSAPSSCSSGGTLGTGHAAVWCTGSNYGLLGGDTNGTSVVYDGYLYAIGGVSEYVEYTQIGSNGSIAAPSSCGVNFSSHGVWCSINGGTGGLPEVLYESSSVAYNGYIYTVGNGEGGSGSELVSDTKINTANGSPSAPTNCATDGGTVSDSGSGAWCNFSASLPIALANTSTEVYNGYLYVVGGDNASSVAYNNVYHALINQDGSLGTWSSTNNLPPSGGVSSAASVIYGGYIYEIGGESPYGSSNSTTTVYYTQVNNGGPYGINNFNTSSTGLTTAVENASSVVYNGYLYEIGGSTDGTAGNAVQNIQYTQLSDSGAMTAPSNCTANSGSLSGGPWCSFTTTPSELPSAIFDATSVAYNGYLYVIGGDNSSNNALSTVYYTALSSIDGSFSAPACSGGTLSPNSTTGPWCTGLYGLPSAIYDASTALYSGYIYEIGGTNNGTGPGASKSVYYTKLSSSGGTLSAPATSGCTGVWCTSSAYNLAYPTYDASAVVDDGTIFVLGGNIYNNSATSISSNVYFSNIASTKGTPGSWTYTDNLPGPVYSATAIVNDGYIYVLGGNSGTASSQYYYSPLVYSTSGATSGSLLGIGNWSSSDNSLPATYAATSVVNDGLVYEIGGNNGANAIASVEYGGLLSIPRIGVLSGVDNTQIDSRPAAFVINGLIRNASGSLYTGMGSGGDPGDSNGGIGLTYRLASSTCTTPSVATQVNLGNGNPLGNSINSFAASGYNIPLSINDGCSPHISAVGQYLWYKITIDDSQSVAFPDSTSLLSYVSGINYYYHPAPKNRLRGGEYLNQNTSPGLSSLDAPP